MELDHGLNFLRSGNEFQRAQIEIDPVQPIDRAGATTLNSQNLSYYGTN
jgi:hypothetical protein